MRRIICSAAISLDGYLARPDGSFDFIPPPDASPSAQQELEKLFKSIDVIAMGRKTLEDTRRHLGADPPAGAWKTYVFARNEPPGERDGLIFTNRSPREFTAELRNQPGKDIFLMGGGLLLRAFLEADLVDRLLLAVVPTLLGEGIPLFPAGFPQREFSLAESRNDAGGVVTLTYERAANDQRGSD